MRSQQVAGDDRRLADAGGQARRFHAVLNAKGAGFEQFPRRAVALFGGVGGNGAGLLGEGEIGITGQIGRLHRPIAGQGRANAEFLLAPINIGQAEAGRWLDQ